MKEIQLANGSIALVDDIDFENLNKYRWYANNNGSGHISVRTTIDNKKVGMGRLLLGVTDPKRQVDHIDGNTLNNQRSNLRECSPAENMRNRMVLKEGKSSKYKGVYWDKSKNKWKVKICCNYKDIHLGRYKSEKEAGLAYNNAAIKFHGEFARLNAI